MLHVAKEYHEISTSKKEKKVTSVDLIPAHGHHSLLAKT